MPSKTRRADDVSEEPPTSIDPYKILSIENDATEDEVKKAYRKAALKHHPDKASGEDKATAKEDFQKVAFAYAILSDPKRRKRYDVTGSTTESIDFEDDDFDWQDFFRAQYQAVTKDAIENFTQQYKLSDEERDDLLEAYKKGKGNMDVIYETVMASNVLEDDKRFRAIIDEAISNGEVEEYTRYTNETEKSKERRIKKAEREAKEAEAEAAKQAKKKSAKGGKATGKKAVDESSLAALIQQRQHARGSNFLDALEDKYTEMEKKSKSKKRRVADDEPPEEAFAAMGERLKKAKSRR